MSSVITQVQMTRVERFFKSNPHRRFYARPAKRAEIAAANIKCSAPTGSRWWSISHRTDADDFYHFVIAVRGVDGDPSEEMSERMFESACEIYGAAYAQDRARKALH